MEVEWGSKGISPLILNTGTREVSDLHTPVTLPAGKDPYSDRIRVSLGVIASLGGAVEQKTSCLSHNSWAGYLSRYSDWLRAGRYGDQFPVGARFSAPVQTGPKVRPYYCTIGIGSFLGLRAAGAWHWPLTHSSAFGHESVELYLYSPYRPYGLYRASVRVQECTLPFMPGFKIRTVQPIASRNTDYATHNTLRSFPTLPR
jgi:hypothetical protein